MAAERWPANSVFIVVRGMILAHTFPVVISSIPMAFNQDVKAIVASTEVDPRFLAYWFVSNGSKLLKITTTATYGTKRFDMKELFEVPIALPKKPEQARIVERLDAAEMEITSNRKMAAKLRSLRSGLMQDLLSGRKRVTPLLDTSRRIATQGS
jgi:type I restriction enzyme, S subunit